MNPHKPTTILMNILLSLVLVALLQMGGCKLNENLSIGSPGGSVNFRLVDSTTQSDITSIQLGDSATIIATVKDAQGALVNGAVIKFESTLGSISPSSQTLTDANGEAKVTINAIATTGGGGGFGGGGTTSPTGAGKITVTATVSNRSIKKEMDFEITASSAASLLSVAMVDPVTSAATTTIQPNGTGRINITVTDGQGQVMPDKLVTVETTLGTLDPSTGKVLTDANGVASIDVLATAGGGFGSTAPVGAGTITATITIGGQGFSNTLNFSISSTTSGYNTTLPDVDSFIYYTPAKKADGFTANAPNVEVLVPTVIDQTVSLTARMGTQANSLVPNGVVVNFVTEGGAVDSSCTSNNGACSANWTGTVPVTTDGRSTVLAWVTGVESYVDVNANGVFDDGDTFTDSSGEAYLDANENNAFDTGEWFNDRNANGQRDGADGLYAGPGCSHSTLCSSDTVTDIFGNAVVIMSNPTAQIINLKRTDTNVAITRITEGVPFSFDLVNSNGNPLPMNTGVSMATTNGTLDWTIATTTIPASSVATNYATTIAADFVVGPGTLTITTTAPVSATKSVITIPVDD